MKLGKLSRKLASGSAFVLASLMAVGGSVSAQEIELNMAWWGSAARAEITQKVIELYESQNPGVHIIGEFSDVAPYWERVATQSAAGEAPDIIQMETDVLQDYSDRGMLVDVEGLGGLVDLASFQPGDLDMGRTNKGLVAVPIGALAPVLVANVTLFNELGIPVPDDTTWTWDDYLALGAQINAKNPKVWGSEALGFEVHGLTIWARQHGEDMWSADGKVGMSADTLTAFYDMLLKCTQTGACPSPQSTVDENATNAVEQSNFAAGRVALMENWSHTLPGIYRIMPEGTELKLLRLPGSGQHPGSQYYKASMYWCLTTQSKHPEAAAKFLSFLVNDPGAAEILLADRSVPVNLTLRDHITPLLNPGAQQGVEFLASIKEEVGAPAPNAPKAGGVVKSVLQRYSTDVIFERMSPHDAAVKFIDEVNQMVR